MGFKLTLNLEREPNFPFYWIIKRRNLKELKELRKRKSLLMKIKYKTAKK